MHISTVMAVVERDPGFDQDHVQESVAIERFGDFSRVRAPPAALGDIEKQRRAKKAANG